MRILIAGAGIGGLTAALSLHAAGFGDVRVLEAAREIREIGVGVNLPPHAVRELIELGLGPGLEQIGLPTAQLSYHDRQGQLIWAEPRGHDAGYLWPQYSVHRGRLQQLLLGAVQERLGAGAVLLGQRVGAVTQTDAQVRVSVAGADTPHQADLLIGADGIRSSVRRALYQESIALASNGWVMYRGAARFSPFLGGRSMVIVGDERQRIVVYPLDEHTLNWLMVRPASSSELEHAELGNWNQPVDPLGLARQLAEWRFDWLDIPALVAATEQAYEYPMTDIDPLPRWSFERVSLLGDAAHAMYPFGSNGASQAILDARVLAYELARHEEPVAGLRAYEAARREQVAQVQLANRRQAGDVMARVSAMARTGAHGQASAELQAVERDYKKLAGFDVTALNNRPSWNVTRFTTSMPADARPPDAAPTETQPRHARG